MARWLRWVRFASFTIAFALVLFTAANSFTRGPGDEMPAALVVALFVFGIVIPFLLAIVRWVALVPEVRRRLRQPSTSAPQVEPFAPPPQPRSTAEPPPSSEPVDRRRRFRAWTRWAAIASVCVALGMWLVPLASHLSDGTLSSYDPPIWALFVFGLGVPFVLLTARNAEQLVNADRPRRRPSSAPSTGPFEPPPPGPPPSG